MTFGEFIKEHECTQDEVKRLLALWIAMRMHPFVELFYYTTRKSLFNEKKRSNI
jgi:hypothetical protein